MEKQFEIIQDFLKEHNLDANIFYAINIYRYGLTLHTEDKKYIQSKFDFEKDFYYQEEKKQFFKSKIKFRDTKVEIITHEKNNER